MQKKMELNSEMSLLRKAESRDIMQIWSRKRSFWILCAQP